jgi:hypothetical protein
VETGTHQQLLALGGHYSALWAHQSDGFLPEEIPPVRRDTKVTLDGEMCDV